jgi:hypothetical protein
LLYGLAMHAAGFFMPRGIRLFGWGLVVVGLSAFLSIIFFGRMHEWDAVLRPDYLMGLFFGVSHLAYGIYLYFTERKNAA